MISIYDDNAAMDRLYMQWGRLGWRNTIGIYADEVDVENLITETTHTARYDGRLLAILMTWVKDYGDFINRDRLLRVLEKADNAVLGAVFDIAIQYGCAEDYSSIIGRCKPAEPAEVLMKNFRETSLFVELQREQPKEEFLKWGLYHATLFFYTDCLRTREWVLENNKNIALYLKAG